MASPTTIGHERRRRQHPGLHQFGDWPLDDLARSIDWTPFFRAWELAGNYPAILDDAVVGESARSLFDDAQEMLDQIIAEHWLTAKGTVGLWRCGARATTCSSSPATTGRACRSFASR